MKVSVCVPIYGVEMYIEQCAVSLFEQTYKDIEYVFVNDCTPDKSIEVLKSVIERYPDRKNQVKIINHEHNLGLAGARNTAVENATGEYILPIDSDDWLDPDAIAKLISAAKAQDSDFIGYALTIEKGGNSLHRIQPFRESKHTTLNLILSDSNTIGHQMWSNMIKRDLFVQNGIHAEIGVNQSEDYSVMPRLFYVAKNPIFVSDVFYHYRMDNENSYMNNIKLASLCQAMKAIEINVRFFKENGVLQEYVNSIVCASMNPINNAIRAGFDYKSVVANEGFALFPTRTDLKLLFTLYKQIIKLRKYIPARAITKIYTKALIRTLEK